MSSASRAKKYPFVSLIAGFAAMMSPYLELRRRSLAEAVEERSYRDLRLCHKNNQVANKNASVVKVENIYVMGLRLITKLRPKI